MEGFLQIVPLSPEHEMWKTLIARLLYLYADALDIDLFSCGSTTCKSQSTNCGLEPDASFCIGDRKLLPDLAIELTVSSGGIDKLQIYQGLQIPEVWFYQGDRFSPYRMKQDCSGYPEITQSQIFPDLDLNLMA